MTRRAYFVDTSYLLVLFRVQDRFRESDVEPVRKKFSKAWQAGHAIFVPGVCILEWGNHVAGINDASARAKAALLLSNEVSGALKEDQRVRKFTLIELPRMPDFAQLVARWQKGDADRLGLVDSAIAEQARRHKAECTWKTEVHIWTGDRALKAVEPDAEDMPHWLESG